MSKFWENNTTFPELAKIAKENFAHRPTSVGNESFFSKVSNIYTPIRKSLTVSHLKLISFLRGNQWILDIIYQNTNSLSQFNLLEEEEEKAENETNKENDEN